MDQWRAELPEVERPSTELVKRVLYLASGLRSVMRRELAELELTSAEFDVLLALRRSGTPYRMKPNQLARSLMLSTGGTTNVTHRLVARGLVERESDPTDARSTWLQLTADGVALAERGVLANSDAHDSLFASTPPEALQAAAAALRELFATSPGLLAEGWSSSALESQN